MKDFLSQYGAAIQVLGSAAFVLLLAWAGSRIKSKVVGDWTYSRYPIIGKTVAVLSAAFVTAAIIYNGGKLFEEDWWVPPAFLIMTICFYWLNYEMFFVTLRWNTNRMEISRPPFPTKSVFYSDVASLTFHATTESVTVRSIDGTSVWFPYSFRSGMAELLAKLSRSEGDDDDVAPTEA